MLIFSFVDKDVLMPKKLKERANRIFPSELGPLWPTCDSCYSSASSNGAGQGAGILHFKFQEEQCVCTTRCPTPHLPGVPGCFSVPCDGYCT